MVHLSNRRNVLTVVGLILAATFFVSQHADVLRQRGLLARRRLLDTASSAEVDSQNRLLYIVTSIHEFDIGRRETTTGYDRFSKTLVPVIREAVRSMVASGFQVDVYLITHYKLSDTRYRELGSQLPDSVGLQIWDEAAPIAYPNGNSSATVELQTRGLARQHRYVIKDKIFLYDIFVNFEDDMLIRGAHISHFVDLTQQLYDWRRRSSADPLSHDVAEALRSFHGPMTRQQLGRVIPGFVRVETALDDMYAWQRQRHRRFDQISVTLHNRTINASICCELPNGRTMNEYAVPKPTGDNLYYWETSIDALGIRRLPDNESWVVLLGGSNNEIWEDPSFAIGDYWSGRDPNQYFGAKERPDRKLGRYMSNQGGWMATRRQIVEWQERWCRGNFLPPYDLPFFPFDGLDLRTVEYWSGGIQLVGVNSCNLQRIVSLDPDGFARSLLYHTSNNKQRQRPVQKQFSGHNINQFWGQLQTLVNAAEVEIQR